MRAFDDTTHARTVSPMTPDLFHQSAALVLASTAIARRLVLRMFYGDVFPNLFVLWLAVTTLWRKTTALDVARKIVRAVFPHLLFAQETTSEALLSDMAGNEPANFGKMSMGDLELWQAERNFAAQRGLIADEMSGTLAGAGYDLLTPDLSERLHGIYGRLPTQALKVSMILAALDWTSGNAPVIELTHFARAVSIVECWRASAHRMIGNATRSDFDNLRDRIIRVVGRSEPGGVTLRDLCRAISNRQPSDVRDAAQQLIEIGELEVAKAGTTGRGGRPTDRYRIAR